MTLVTSFVVGYVDFTAIFNPQFSYDNVVHGERNLGPCVVIASLTKDQVTHTVHFYLQIAPAEFRRNREVKPGVPEITFAMERCNRRMMADLEKQISI